MASYAVPSRNVAHLRASFSAAASPLRFKTASATPLPRHALSRQYVKATAFFGLGGNKGKAADSKLYICIDCGYIYDMSDPWAEVPNYYRCPKCNSPKSRFKMYKKEVKGRPQNSKSAMDQRMKEKAW